MAPLPIPRQVIRRARKMRAAGYSYQEIADKLGISYNSVSNHTGDVLCHKSQPARGNCVIPYPDPLLKKLIKEHPKEYARYSQISSESRDGGSFE